jgi:predicted transposase YbfD/YdcC
MDVQEKRETFLDFISSFEDHRLERRKLHSLEEILLLTLAAIVCGCEGWRDIERFGKAKLPFLKQHFPYQHGVPSDDTLRRFFRSFWPQHFRSLFAQWAQGLEKKASHVAIDGKVSRHTFDGEGNPLHMVSAFASEFRLVLGQEKVADKSNEITAIPKLLEALDLQGSVVTIDAMGCQREIAGQICDAGAAYVLSLKGDQGTLHDDVRLVFEDEALMEELGVSQHRAVDKGHGRLETRVCRSVVCPEILKKQHAWPGLNSLVEVESTREVKGFLSREKRCFITAVSPDSQRLAEVIRAHWSIENSLHWVLDVSFRDDDSRIRKGHGPENIAVIKHIALNLLQKAKGKRDSIKQLRKAAGWEDEQLRKILFGQL